MKLPEDFITKMKDLLKDEAEEFFSTYEEPKVNGLRANPIKIEPNQLQEIVPFTLEKIPFCPTGFYYDETDQPGKHPYHLAGLYYIQEPSAMFPVEVLAPKPGEKVLDLCAAPGGKSTQIAGMMNNKGLLISNEIHPKRVKALSENIERLGITNTIVTNESPEKLSLRFTGFFDKVLVDAPCSGEGMFRKDPEAIEFWSLQHVERCSFQQNQILQSAYQMLKPNGILVYSTCTFSPEENEQVIESILKQYPDLDVLEIHKFEGMENGRTEWSKYHNRKLLSTVRMWPHRMRGEGHFVAKLVKKADEHNWQGKKVKSNISKQQMKEYVSFEKKYLHKSVNGIFYAFHDQIYLLPEHSPSLEGIKVVRAGLHLGELKKNRFEPNHAFAKSLTAQDVIHTLELSSKDETWKKYVKGETLQTSGDRGWMLVTIDGFALGWGKEVKGTLKNFYPKGLRLM
jgi:NOL1/NOP2/sun family putative RNA methylase